MIVRSGHLKDNDLLDCYMAERGTMPQDLPAVDHLSTCPACVARYGELAEVMGALREQADLELDEQFPPERLAAQQQQILNRLEHVNRSARVITFPGREMAGTSKSPAFPAARWLAAAAAAGLFIGLAVGGYLGPDRLHRPSGTPSAASAPAMAVQPQAATPSAVRVSSTQLDAPDDDAFLLELDLALARPHTRELLPFDAMTPHDRDIDGRLR